MKKLISVLIITLIYITFITPGITYAATIKINKKSAIVIEGDYLYLEITGTKKKVTWSSNDEYVATVSKKGKVTTVSVGKASITATIGKKKYTCKVIVMPNLDPDYMTDRDIEIALAERDYLDRLASDTPIVTAIPTPTPYESINDTLDRIKKMNKYGFATSEEMETEIGKAYMDFCNEWVSEHELKNTYDTSVVKSISDDKLYLITNVDSRYIITGALLKPESGTIYTNGEVQYQYLEKFEYDNQSYDQKQYFFSRADLIKVGVIK
jgi:hypothetical protein